jgi:hypothetical protein
MKKILTGVLIVAGLGIQAQAQNTKEGTLNFALTRQYENKTNYNKSLMQWNTATAKVTSSTVIQSIGVVLGKTFTGNAKLVVEDGNWSGFAANNTNGVNLPNGMNTGLGAAGKQQPFAYIFLKDGTNCINVSAFFAFQVRECYDCFYLNSFVTDSKYGFTTTTKITTIPGLQPCCNTVTNITTTINGSGNGTDKYYFTLVFDNTINNANLAAHGITGLAPREDGITPDVAPSGYVPTDPSVLRFTLNGILTYTWRVASISGSLAQIGSVSYSANGFGFIAKSCNLLSGTVSVSEAAVATKNCCSVTGTDAKVLTSTADFNGTAIVPPPSRNW